MGEWGSFDFKDPATGKPKCYPISGTGSNGVTINTLGTTSPRRRGRGGFGGHQLQPLAAQCQRDHGPGRL